MQCNQFSGENTQKLTQHLDDTFLNSYEQLMDSILDVEKNFNASGPDRKCMLNIIKLYQIVKNNNLISTYKLLHSKSLTREGHVLLIEACSLMS